eukprot:1448934-Prymnesium_polylepis.1
MFPPHALSYGSNAQDWRGALRNALERDLDATKLEPYRYLCSQEYVRTRGRPAEDPHCGRTASADP